MSIRITQQMRIEPERGGPLQRKPAASGCRGVSGSRASRAKLGRSAGWVLCLALASSSCATNNGNWSFGISQSAYEGSFWTATPVHAGHYGRSGQSEATGYLVLLALPIVIDIIILPITIIHDVLVE